LPPARPKARADGSGNAGAGLWFNSGSEIFRVKMRERSFCALQKNEIRRFSHPDSGRFPGSS
jgi:hypothetical protein